MAHGKLGKMFFQFLLRQLITPTLIPSILIHLPYLMSTREYFSRQRTLSSDLWKRKRMERQLLFSFGLEDILQWPLSIVLTNDVMVAWSHMWWTFWLPMWPDILGGQCLHFYSLKWRFQVDTGIMQKGAVFDIIILQMYYIFQLLTLDVEIMILSFISPSIRAEPCNFARQICKWRLS